MNRLLALVRVAPADPDGHLLARFLADRDEAAFAELVRRHAPVVWGVCRRRLPDPRDAEDAFQAAFLVLVRRARRVQAHPALGPWLYRVAALTARNLARANRRRQPLAAPLDGDPAEPDPAARADARLDLDDALLSLSDRQRAAVVLCHLEGLTHREAADRLGCAVGTLSATVSAALRKLRARLGGRDPMVVFVAAGTVIPVGLPAASARVAAVYTTSALRAGVPPAVLGLTEGVLRMVWVKKLTAAGVVLAAAGSIGLGVLRTADAGGQDPGAKPAAGATAEKFDELEAGVKQADDAVRAANDAAARAEDRRLLAELKLAAARRSARTAPGEDAYLEVRVTGPSYAVWPADGGRVNRFVLYERSKGPSLAYATSDIATLAVLLTRATADPTAAKDVMVSGDPGCDPAEVRRAFAACRAVGLDRVKYRGPLAGSLAGLTKGAVPITQKAHVGMIGPRAEFDLLERTIDLNALSLDEGKKP